MKRTFKMSGLAVWAAASLIVILLLAAGCSRMSTPTGPQEPAEPQRELWNPQPGDRVAPGHDVPILNDDYWESDSGPQVNPWLLQRVFRLIGLTGGTVTLGYHSYAISAGAVPIPTLFSLAYASYTGVAVDCGPSPFEFLLPVTLSLSYRGTQYEDWTDPPPLQIFYMDEGGSLTPLPSTVDVSTRTVTAQTDHFSRYIIG